MKYLNAQQLAFILDMNKEDARARMCNAWCKSQGIENKSYWNEKDKIIDPYPVAMPIEILSKELNLPTLQQAVDDIVNLVRPAAKKWILCDYPEKKIKAAEKAGKKMPIPVKLPPALLSMLPTDTVEVIKSEWVKRYKVSV